MAIKLRRENTNKEYMDTVTIISTIEEYQYDTEDEQKEHRKELEKYGYEHTGKIKNNIGTEFEPVIVLWGSFARENVYREDLIEYV